MFAVGFIGFGAAAYWDLKTTEFSEFIPYSMIIIGLIIHGIASFVAVDLSYIIMSTVTGLAFLGLGSIMYFLKQWGDGDAWLLGAMGFLFPISNWFTLLNPQLNLFGLPFQLILLMNFFFVSFAYLITYSIMLGIRSPKQTKKFFRELKGKARIFSLFFALLFCSSIVMVFYAIYSLSIPLARMVPILSMPVIFSFVFVFIHYGRFVEKNLFKKTVDVKNIKVGDVPTGARWRGLTENEIKQLKKKGGTIQIKEGVRFAPTFFIAILITIIFGNVMLMFI